MLQNIDEWFYHTLNLAGFKPLDAIVEQFASERNWLIILTLGLAYIAVKKRGLFKPFVVALLTVGITDFVCFRALKPTFQRIRPCHALEEYTQVGFCGSQFGFPSNHAANTATFLTTGLAIFPRRPWLKYMGLFTLLMGLSRVYMGVHYPGDVLFGYLVGAVIGFFGYGVIKQFIPFQSFST